MNMEWGWRKAAFRLVPLFALVAALASAMACSERDSELPPRKTPITVDPDVFIPSSIRNFSRLAKAETRALPTELTANGTVTPDVNSTIHVTSQGSGRVVELKVRLGDYVKKGQTLLVISSHRFGGCVVRLSEGCGR